MASTKEELEERLNERQKAFCRAYIYEWNATKSYQEAYPEADYNTCKSNGYKLLTNTYIQEYISLCEKEYAKLAGVSALKNIKELAKIAYSENAKVKNADKIKAIEIANKMLGLNAPEKIEVDPGEKSESTFNKVNEFLLGK